MKKVFAAYVAVFVMVNLIVHWCGAWIIPLTTMACVAANMLGRDKLLLEGGAKFSIGACTVAGLLTCLVLPDAGQVAIASLAAVVCSAIVSAIAWGFFPDGHWKNNIISAVADALVFPTVAFGAFLPLVSLGQFAGKFIAVSVIAYLMRNKW